LTTYCAINLLNAGTHRHALDKR